MSEIFVTNANGFELIGLRNERVELTVAPALGGKIVGLIDRRTSRQWMWHPGQNLKLFANTPGDAFERSTMIGADECLPSVAPCTVDGRAISDHGEVWSIPWQTDRSATERGEIALHVSLPISPLDFARTIRLDNNAIEFRYELRNRSAAPQHYLWAFHPLLKIEPGDEIELSPGMEDLSVESTGWPDTHRGQKWNWPAPRAGVDLSRMDLGSSPAYAKCFTPLVRTGSIAIANSAANQRLRIECASPHITTLGFWLTRGGWNGYHHVAIEPTNAAADSLQQAITENLCKPIPPHGSIAWSFRMVIGF